MITPDTVNGMLEEFWPDVNVRCSKVSAEAASAVLTPRPVDVRPGGFISGPAQFAAADSAFWFLVSGVLDRAEPMALTSELSIRFLRPAIGDTLVADAVMERAGKTRVVATIRVWTTDPDRPCSVAQGTYALPRDD